MSSEAVRDAYAQAAGRWTGCDWATRFGHSELDLNGMRAGQALVMARATAGVEAADWRDAARWLAQVEEDASEAEEEARAAVALAGTGKLEEALERAGRACAKESGYHHALVWQPLREALEGAPAPDAGEG